MSSVSMAQVAGCAGHRDADGLTAADRAPPELASLVSRGGMQGSGRPRDSATMAAGRRSHSTAHPKAPDRTGYLKRLWGAGGSEGSQGGASDPRQLSEQTNRCECYWSWSCLSSLLLHVASLVH